MPDIDTLYDALKADGAVTKSREHFRSKMLASGAEGYKNRKQLYDALKADGAVSSKNYEEFAARLGLHAVKPAPAKPAVNTAKQILKSRPTMQIVDGKSVPAKQRNVQPAAKSGTNPLTQASQRFWQAQAEMVKPVTPAADTKSYAPGELLQKPKSNRELVDAAKKQLHATKPQAQAQPWKFSEQVHSSNQNEPSLAGAIDSATEAVKRQHASMTAQLKLNSPLPMTKEEVAARAEDEVAHEDYVAEQNRQQDFDRGINGLLAKYKTKDAAEKAWANAEARTKASREAHNDKIWSDYAMMGGGPQARMAAAGETYTSNLADYLKEHDLQMMANDAWASLGRAKQQGLISGMADIVRKQYPKMSDGEVRKMATRLARQHSDQAVFDLAVKKNTPKSATDLFLRHAIGMSSVAMLQEGLARSKAGSTGDWAAREVAEQKYNKGLKNKAASIAGSVVGLAVDPLTIISAGVSSVGAKAATAASAKLIGKAATRKAATTLGGRIAMGAIQGAANFGTFEAGREVAEQARWGGHRNEDTGDVEGYSLGAVGKQFGHGAVMGAATGVVAPMVGNISDKLVKATASTAGKAAIRTGELGVSTLAEGTIFSVPEWASGNRDAMDVWTDNLAMMAGFKGHHLIKSVPHTIDALRKADNPSNMAERNHNRRSFEERLRMVLDGQHTDLALSKEEQDELKRGGYDDLNILVTDHARYVDKQKPDGKSREADPSRTIESKTHNDDVSYDIPYNRFEQLMSDGQISEAARAKMYYYLTGHVVPMSTVIGGSTFESVGQDGKTNYTVQSIGANGVVTSRTFANKRQADLEETRIMRQAELNGIDIGEQHYNNLADSKRFSRACNIVADEIGAPVNMIKELMHRDPNTITPTEQDVVKRVTEHYDSLADDFSLDAVRKDVETDTGVDIDKAISKDASKRSSDEQRAVKTYISRLYDGVKMPKWEFVNDPSYNTRRIDITDDDTPYDDEVADEEKGEMPVDHSADKAYTDGYNATDVADRKDVKMRHDELRGELSFATDEDFKILDDSPTVAKEAVMSHDDWSENQKEQALAYINAKEALAGVVDRIKEDADSMEAQQYEELKQKQHTDGALHPATLKETDEKGHGKEVFIVDGHVQMTEDGSMVDHANSDKTVVVFDPTTGERKMIDPTSDTGLSAVGEVLNFEDEQAKISENAQQYIQEQYDEMNGKVRVELGQKIVLPTGEDAVVVAIFPDNGNITAMLEDGSQKNVSRAELQQMADEQALTDYRQRHGMTGEQSSEDEPPASSEVSEPAEVTQGESVVEGAPSDFTPDMELTIRDEDGTEKPALVMGRVRYEDGSFVPDDNGSIVEYYADGEVMHEHESKLADKVVSHVSSEQEDVQAVDTPATEAEAPKDDNTSDSDVVAADEDVTENVPATHAEVSEETTDEAEEKQEQTALSRIPKDEKGNPILEETDPETAWDGTVEYMDNAEDAREYVDGMVAQLTKEVESAKKRVGKVKNTGSMEQFKADKAAAREEQAAAERRLAHWQQIAGVDEARKEAERQRAAEVRAEEERIAHDKAVEEEKLRQEEVIRKREEQTALGANIPHAAIKQKWDAAEKIDGNPDEITLPDGDRIKGHYVLVESGVATPSHNPTAEFVKNEGFPVDENGKTINDRDYEGDKDAQEITRNMAATYDSRALQDVPVVSQDGVVLSGNGRTMAGELAARDNTDGVYNNHLLEYGRKFGFTPEQVTTMQHPRVVFVADEEMPYTADTFAKFNHQEKKGLSKTEQAVKLGKVVDDATFGRITSLINGFNTLGEFYQDKKASTAAVTELQNAGVISQMQYGEMFDGDGISVQGRELLENMLIGKAFANNPDAVREITTYKNLRQSIVQALSEIVNNTALGEDYKLENELAQAIQLVYDARNNGYKVGERVSEYARQMNLFPFDNGETVADYTNATIMMLADALNDGRSTWLKTVLQTYNKRAKDASIGQMDLFTGEVETKDDIIKNAFNELHNGQQTTNNGKENGRNERNKGKEQNAIASSGNTGSEARGRDVRERDEVKETVVKTEHQKPNDVVSDGSSLPADKGKESSEELQGKEDKFTPVPIEDGEDYVDYAARVAAVKAQHDAIKAAENATDTNPTDGQKKAGNYKKGHVQIGAFDISVEQPKGSVRRGKDADGKEWESKMNNTYGYFRGTEGVDGDHIDVFLSNDIDGWNGRKVFVVDQYNPDGTFDEHKVMLGFNDADDAKSNYLANYEKGWENGRRIEVSTTDLEDFEKWISSSHRKTKPFAEYKGVRIDEVQSASHQLPYSIEPATYTNKKGKTTPMHLLKFDADLTKEQTRAINEFAKEKLSDGRFAKARGWRDRESGGWMFRSEEDAKKAAEMVNDAKAVEDAQPLSVEDMAEATDHAAVKAVDEAIKVEQEPQTTPQYDYDRENNVYDTVLAGLRETFNNRPAGSIPNIKAIEKEIRDLRKRAKTIENGMATATGETIPQAFDALAGLNGRRKAFEQFLTDLRVKMAEVGRDKALAAHGLKLGDKIMYKGKEATIYDADQYQVTLDVGLAPIVYEAVDWNKLELPQHNKEQQDGRVPSVEHKADEVQGTLSEKPNQKLQPKKVNVGSLFGELYKDGKAKLSDHTEEPKQESRQEESQEQPKQEEKKAKSKWVDDEDAERFEELRKRLKAKLRGQLNMGVDPEIFAAGVEMSYLMLKHGARKFAEFSKQMLEALGEEVRPYLKSFYNGARDLPEMEDYEKEMTPYDEVRDFDVKNFDKEGAKDLVETAEHIVREQEVEQEAKEATKKLKEERNEEKKEDNKQSVANTDQKDVEASKEQVTKPTSTTDFIRNKGRFMSEADIEGALGKIFVDKETGSEIKVGKFVSPHDVAIKINGDASIILWPRLANTLNKENWQEVNNERVDAQEDTAKESGQDKKDISLQQQSTPDLFSGLSGEKDNLKLTSNEQEVHVQPRTSTTERKGGYQRGQDESLGASQQHEDERTDTSRVAGRSGDNTMSDSAGSSRVSKPSDGKRDVKPSKPEPAPLAESERKNIHNNHAERGTDYAPKSVSARIEANIKAIETMQRLVGSGQPATPEDMAVLRKFSGWGGLGEAFSEMKGGPYGSINTNNKRLRELLSPEAYEAANMSRNSAYYTPAPVIDTLWDVARAMGFRGGNVLEGSAGVGNILGLMPTDMSEQSNIHAVEIDETAGNILSLLYPDANVEVKGFEKTHVTNGSVDLAITNVPFVTGLRVMDETGDKDLSRKFHDIHDFCIAKNVRKLKDGGVGIFITSSGTLDSPNSAKLRTWLVNEGGADVVGAFRMHNQTFGGTGATSDIIVVRKRVNGQKSANAIDVSGTLPIRTVKYNTGETKRGSSKIIIKDLALDVNKHFVEHPEDMAGEMAFAFEKGDTYRATSKSLYPSQSINQEQRLSEWAQQFKDMDWDKAEERESQQVVYGDLGEDIKEGSMLLDSDGNLCLAQRGKAVPINVNANKVKGHTKAECFNAYKTIKDAVADVLEYQRTHSNDTGLKQKLDMLNKAYDAFVKTYGHLNKNTSISFLRSDIDFPSIAALESVSETSDKSGKRIVTYGKTDIFNRRVVETESEPKPTTIKDGIIASIYLNGRVDVPYIAERLNMSDADVRQQIIESGLGFENPTTTEMEVSYEYLSGNVREKLYQAKENNTDGRYDENIKALERVIPMNIPAHLIEFTLGSSWIEPKLYEDFVKERTGLDVKLTNAGGTWVMSEPYWTNTEKNKAMGVISEKCDKTILGHELIKAAITCKSINVTKTISTGYGSSKTTETIVDKEATMACANKIDEIRQDFKDWARGKMQNDPEMSERMELVYNDLFNNSVPKEIPNEFVPEHFGGAASVVNGKPFQLRPHQAKAVIRATTQPLMLAHEVGTGKTYTLISTAMEMRRLGTARKPMIVVQNATVGQFVASAKALYPNAKVLTIEDADRNAEGRRNFYAKIRYNDWDMVVVPQSVFERIPDSEERQIRFIEDKVEEKMMVLEKMREAANDDRDPVLRQVQRELDKLNDELNDHKLALSENKADGKVDIDKKREAKTKQNAMVKAQEMLDREIDDAANFDDMGIDALLIDEAHEYKHLGFATAMQRGVKGVDPSYSKKSQGVYLKTQAVLENKNGKNVIFATGTPISNTAAEIWTFMRYLMPADTMREYGIYYFDDFVRNFGNIQQMLEFATNGKYKENNRFAGYVNLPELVRIWACVADTVLTREAGGVSDKIPKMEGGKAQDIYLPQTKALRSVMKFVKEQLDSYEDMSGKEKKENSHIPLVMYGIAKAAAVDARLVLGDAVDELNSKTNEAVRQTLRSLEDTKEYNGTVAIFADNYQNKVSGFNLYEDIRKKLIDAGVPEAQVVVMKSGMSIKKKLEIFDKVNRGEVRVIMGSTFTLGTGVNIQERLHTLIHVDAPNRPMDYTQRNGRILRQGNLHNEWGIPVRVLRFGVEDSLDVTAYQRLKTKGAIADSIMEGKKMMSNSMEDRVLEEEQDLFGDITAQLSGSQYALLKNQVEKEVRKLEARQKQWEADQAYVHNQKPRLKALIKDSEERAERNKKSLAKVEAAKNDGITIGKMKFSSLDDMADYLKEYNSKQREQQEQVRMASGYNSEAKSDLTINVGGFDFHVKRVITKDQKKEKGQLSLSFFSKTKMTYSCPELGLEDVPVDGQRLKSALEDILENVLSGDDFREKAEYADRAAERYKGELQQVEARDGKPFEYADELKQAKNKLAEYEELMKAEMAVKDAKYAEMDASVETANSVTLSDEASEENEDDATYRDYDDDESWNDATQENANMMRTTVQQMSEKLHTPIKIIEDIESITHQNASVQERRRNSKGWYDVRTGEVVVVLPNNRDVEDVAATVMHETVAHKGLRELVGEEHYDDFLDEVYEHLRGDLKQRVDAEAGRSFVDDSTKNGERAKSYERHRRTAVDELFGDMAEKPFEEFSEGERTLWQKLKEVVRKLLDKFLESLKLPKWFELGDNELRYMLWRSKERLERGKEHPIDLARDMVMREELGLSEAARMRMGDAPDTFKARQKRAVEEKGVVMPGLNEAEVKEVDVPRHQYKNRNILDQARDAAIERYNKQVGTNEDGTPKWEAIPQEYNNYGISFFYEITPKALKSLVQHHTKSDNVGVHTAVLDKLHEVINGSIEYEEDPDVPKINGIRDISKGVNENVLIHRFIGTVRVDGKTYRVISKIKEYRETHINARPSTYQVTEIGVFDDETPNTPNGSKRANGYVHVAKLLKDVEKSYDSGKKVLDESRKADENPILYRDGEETEDIWKDKSMGLHERTTAAAMRLADKHQENKTLRNDAMRAIGNNLADLRKAMSLQRRFDMATVKRVSDLARVLMNNGYIGDMTQQEVKSLLAAVRNSVGHNDIDRDVQKVMEIMVKNQLRRAEKALGALEAIKGSKVNAKGVKVQGKLDAAGAQLMEVFKKTRGWEKKYIEEAIADAQGRMSSDDATVAENATIEYAGLQFAMEYAEKIRDSKVEESRLKEEIKKSHEETSERNRNSESYRQYIASLQDAILQNKIERAEAYFNLVGRLSDGLRESMANATHFKKMEKMRINEIHHYANSDMQGRPSNEHYKPEFADKFVNNSFVSFVFAPLATFDQMLRVFGNKSANGEGYLYNRFMRGWVDARQQEIKGVREKFATLDDKAKEIFGGKVKTWSDLIRYVGNLPKGVVSFWNGGEMQEYEMAQGNLMYIYMVNKMLDGKMKLRKMGITDEHVENIAEVLDPRLIKLADWLQGEFLVDTRNEYNETHKRMFGASMAAVEDYFPLKILANAREDKPENLDNPDSGDGISTSTGSIVKRTRNGLALDLMNADALHVILDHVAQMEHWNAFVEFNRDLNTLRTYKRFRNQVQNMTTIYGSGKELWKKFNDVCQMAAGTYRPPRAKLDEAAVNFAKGVTAAKVSFRTFTALKQFLSLPAYIPEVRADYLLKSIVNPVEAWTWSMEHLPIFNERWNGRMAGDPRLLKTDKDWKLWRTRIVQLAARVGMSPNAFVDALTVCIGARAMYQTRLAQYLREGYSQEAAEKRAIQDAEILYNQTQQSSEGAFLSTMQVDRSWLSVLFTIFRNSSMAYTRQLYDALRNLERNLTPGYREGSIAFMKKQFMDDGIDDVQAERNAKRKYYRQLRKDFLRVATFSFIMQFAWNLGAYLPYLLFGDDDQTKKEFWNDVLMHTLFGSIEGLTGGDIMSQAGNMLISGEGNPVYLIKDMPLISDLKTVFEELGNGQYVEALSDMVNLIVQSGIGVNPQSITDTALAIMDACGDDPVLAHEATICVSRILQVPQSQIDKMYFDEVGLSGSEASKYTPAQLAERYARFKVKRGAFFAPWAWDDEGLIGKKTDNAEKIINARVKAANDTQVNEAYLKYEDSLKDIDKQVSAANEAAKTDYLKAAQMYNKVQSNPKAYNSYLMFKEMDNGLNRLARNYMSAKSPEEARLHQRTIQRYKAAMVKALNASNERERDKAIQEIETLLDDYSNQYEAMQGSLSTQ